MEKRPYTDEELHEIITNMIGNDESVIKTLVKIAGQAVIEVMITAGVLDLNKSFNIKSFEESFNSHKKNLSTLQVKWIITIDNQFVELAQYAANERKLEAAIVLIVTAIEHKVNIFFSDVLTRSNLSSDEVNQIIRMVSVQDKISWLLSILDSKLREILKKEDK